MANELKVSGKILSILPTQTGQGKNGDWKKQDVIIETDGDYDGHKAIYQEYVEFPKDKDGDFYQAGVFYSYEACALGFRKGGKILNNMSKFVGHIVK